MNRFPASLSPRATLLIIAGVVLYLTLAFYHGHRLRQLPGSDGNGRSPDPANQEENWVQVTTMEPGATDDGREPLPAGSAPPGDHREQTNPAGPKPALRDDTLRQQLHTAAEKQAMLKKDLEKEQEKNQELILEKENLQFKIKAILTNLQETRSELQQANQKLRDNPETEELKRHLRRKTEALRKANRRIEATAGRLDDASAQLHALEKTVRELKQSMAREQNRSRRAMDTVAGLQNENDQLQRQQEQSLIESARLDREMKAVKSRLLIAEQERDQARLKAEAMLRYGLEQDRLMTPFQQQVEVLNGRVLDANNRLLEAEESIATLQEERQNLSARIQELGEKARQYQEARASFEEAEQELAATKNREQELLTQLKELADQLAERNTVLASRTRELTSVQDALKEVELDRDHDRETLKTLRLRLSELTARLAAAEKDKDDLTEQIRQAGTMIKKLESDDQRRQNELAGLREETEKLRAASIPREELNKRDRQLKNMRRELDTMRQRLKTTERDLAQAVENARAASNDKQQLRQRLVQLKKKGREQAGEIRSLQKKNSALKTDLDLRERSYAELREELSKLREQHEQSRQEAASRSGQAPDTPADKEVVPAEKPDNSEDG